MKKVTVNTLHKLKDAGEKFACLTCYDALFAGLFGDAGVEVILVGDSLGMVLQGHDSTLPVTMDDMVYHMGCVKRGNKGSLLIADLPFMSYASEAQTLENAARLMRAGAQMVKLEGGVWIAESTRLLAERGIPVCAHLGLTPQSVNVFGGYRVQGRTPKEAKSILADAVEIQDAGASLLVLECIPANLAADISSKLDIPVIGIGAGAGTDAQVLVLHDMLGLTENPPKFVENFMTGANTVQGALAAFVEAVKTGAYPREEHTYS